ncbi:glycosyltransferase [Shinella sp.]|uniref:glycosyltransferase n=1 Tax=Shinella sp. TaxID=1870904 RepID=UPI00289C2611|nr:glycosyltransferase [Shinella sp.]
MTTPTATIIFVSNDIDNFRHHRTHLVDVAVELNMDVVVLAGGNGIPPKNCEYQNVKIDRFQFHWTDFNIFKSILINIFRRRPAILHLVNLKPYLYGGIAARIAKSLGWQGKLVVSVPGLGRLYDGKDLTLAKKMRTKAIELVLKVCLGDATICFETSSDRDFWIKRGLTISNKTELTNGTGIDLAQFRPPRRRVSGRPLKVLYAGRLLKAKGLDVFLRTAEISQMENVEMVVAGQTEADPDGVSESILRDHPCVVFLGKVDDMPHLLGQTDIVVLPSRYNEGVPRILIEAAACGCVSIATDFAGSRALIEEGVTGFFLRQATIKGQSDEILSIIENLSENPSMITIIGNNAREHLFKGGFSSDAVKAAFQRVYSH